MSVDIATPVGIFKVVVRDGQPMWLLVCPGCGEAAELDDDQWHGRVSVDHASMGCPGGYHETHDYATALRDSLPEDAPVPAPTPPSKEDVMGAAGRRGA